MCAAQAGQRGRRILVLEHGPKVGAKILISGGGRCNFTNTATGPANFVSENPHFAKSALARFSPADFVSLVKERNISFYEKKLGQLFCTRSAREIVELLQSLCTENHVRFQLDCKISDVEKLPAGNFKVGTNRGEFCAASLVVATGGLSIPEIGASDLGYRIAKQFGLKIVPTAPALDGFTFGGAEQNFFSELSGLSTEVVLTAGDISFTESLLFTHRGLSGPAALQGSLHWRPGAKIIINLCPQHSLSTFLREEKKRRPQLTPLQVLAEILPRRLAEAWLGRYFPDLSQLANLADDKLTALAHALNHWELRPSGTVGYRKAEVTRGGVDTRELSSKTMEAQKVPGLYFIGEVVDVTGWLGGYNFQWAWASGWAAAQNI